MSTGILTTLNRGWRLRELDQGVAEAVLLLIEPA